MKERAMMHLIRDVHILARVYHWPEPAIFQLGLRRRLAYLSLIDEDANADLVARAPAAEP
jgi:hypothetical protein